MDIVISVSLLLLVILYAWWRRNSDDSWRFRTVVATLEAYPNTHVVCFENDHGKRKFLIVDPNNFRLKSRKAFEETHTISEYFKWWEDKKYSLDDLKKSFDNDPVWKNKFFTFGDKNV